MPVLYDKKKTRKGTTIFKNTPNSKYWYLRKVYAGVDEYFCLGNDLDKAKALADEIDSFLQFHTIRQTREHFYPAERELSAEIPTFQEVIWWIRKAGRLNGLSQVTIENYENSIQRLALHYAPPGKNRKEEKLFRRRALNKPITLLNKRLWAAVVEDFLQFNGGTLSPANKRSINSLLANVQAAFHERHTSMFPFWNPEWVKEIMEVRLYPRVGVKYRLPPEDLIVRTVRNVETMEEGPVKNCLVLALRAGLRRREISFARKDWVDVSPVVSRLYVKATRDFQPKGCEGYAEIETRFIERLVFSEGEFLLGVDREYDRVDVIPMKAVATLREWGWTDYANPLHELRKLYGSVLASTRGLYSAQVLLRHSNSQVTSDNYADLVVSPRILQVWAGDDGTIHESHQGNSGGWLLPLNR